MPKNLVIINPFWNLVVIITILIISPWSWQIFSSNLLLLVLIWTLSIVLLFAVINPSNKLKIVCGILFTILIIWQYITTKNTSLNYINPTEEYLLNARRVQMSSISFSIAGLKINPNLGKFLQSRQAFMIYKFQENFFRSLDINEYFFAGHPREREGIREFEKFNFMLFPLFILGLYMAIIKRYTRLFIGLIVLHLVLGVIGTNNYLGVFILYPYYVVLITLGVMKYIKHE